MNHAGTATKPITLANYPGERPILRAATSAGENTPLRIGQGAAFFRVRSFIIESASGASTTNVYVSEDAHDIEISHNEIRNSAHQGIFLERTTSRVQILSNLIHDNGSSSASGRDHGIYIEGTDQLVANNVIYDQQYGLGIQVYPASNRVIVTSNTVVGNGYGGVLVGGDGSTASDNSVVVNNIVAFNRPIGIHGYYGHGPTGAGNVAYNNLVFSNGTDLQNDPGPSEIVDFSRGNITADPRFVNLASANFRVQQGSPAIGLAVTAFAEPVDINGRGRPQATPTLGAYESATR